MDPVRPIWPEPPQIHGHSASLRLILSTSRIVGEYFIPSTEFAQNGLPAAGIREEIGQLELSDCSDPFHFRYSTQGECDARRTIMDRVRMDKCLWAARFFKTRALAVRACELGGPARFVYHGVAPLKDVCHPLTGSVRINLTFRKVF